MSDPRGDLQKILLDAGVAMARIIVYPETSGKHEPSVAIDLGDDSLFVRVEEKKTLHWGQLRETEAYAGLRDELPILAVRGLDNAGIDEDEFVAIVPMDVLARLIARAQG